VSGLSKSSEVSPVVPQISQRLTHPFKEQDSAKRAKYILPPSSKTSSPGTPSQSDPPSGEPVSRPETSQPETSRKERPRPVATKKSKKLPSQTLPEASASQSLTPLGPPPTTTQAMNTTELSQNTPTSTPIPPAPGNAVDPIPSGVPSTNEDMVLLATALSVHQLLSQAAAGSQGLVTVSEGPGVEPIQSTVNPSQLSINSSEVANNPSQPLLGSSQVPAEIVVTRSDPGVTPTPPQLASNVTSSAPKVRYRTRAPTTTVSRLPVPLRRNSIDGAPPMDLDLHENAAEDSADNDASEIVVDLRKYVGMIEDDDNETHVSSSQKSDDECWTLEHPQPPPSSRQRSSSSLEEGGQPQHPSTYAQPVVDNEDLPTWMTKKGQWRYIASTAGGPAWNKLLDVYIQQERRLEFTEMVSHFLALSHPL